MAWLPGATGRHGRLAAGTLLLAGIAMVGAGFGWFDADADEVLQNGGFETWTGDTPSGWSIVSGTASRDDSRSESGAAVKLTGTSTLGLQQVVTVGAGSTVSASIGASSDAAADVTLAIYPLDEDFAAKASPVLVTQTISAGAAFSTVSLSTAALPAWTAYARVQVTVAPVGVGSFSAWLDSASAYETVALPTATATATPSPTSVATSSPTATPDADASPGDSPTATATTGSVQATPTAKPTKGATEPATKTATRAPTPKPPAKTPTPTPRPKTTPTPTNPDAAMTGLVLNGDFEALDDGKPAYWAKYGGDMGATSAAYAGKWSATLSSTTTSTKWLNQVVSVDAGGWYQLTAVARAENATAFLRISWYTSTDGSGSQIDSVDGSESDSGEWTTLDTGSVQAPADAASARVKLMLRPNSGSGRVLFDDAWLVAAAPGAPTSSPTAAGKTPATASTASRTPTRTATAKTAKGATKTPAGASRSSANGGGPTAAPLSATGQLTGPSPLRLSEFMSDPPKAGNDGSDEWIEIVNVSSEPVSTTGWRISDAKAADAIPQAQVAPGGYLVIAGKSADTDPATSVVHVADGVIGNGLSNSGDAIALLAPSGETADAVSYGSNTDIFEPPPAAPGRSESLGTRDPAADPAAENWEITLQPSPGEANRFEQKESPQGSATGTNGHDGDSSGSAGPRALTASDAHHVPALGTLDWALIVGMFTCVSAVAGVFGRRYFDAAWKRVRRGH